MSKSQRLHQLAQWLDRTHHRIHGQVSVRERGRGSDRVTVVRIDHRLPCDLEEHAGWHLKTSPTFLPLAHFSSQVRAYVKSAESARGRAIYCYDLLEEEVVSAIAYHIDADPRMPVLITTLGFRTDSGSNAWLRSRTLAGALVLKHHLHAVADKIGRGGFIDIDLADRSALELASDLGFRPAPRLKGFRPGGIHLRQPAPAKSSARGGGR